MLSLSLLKMLRRWVRSTSNAGGRGYFRESEGQNSVTSLPELLGMGGGLTTDTSAPTTFAVGPAGAASLIYGSAATVAATSETATAGPAVFGDYMGSSFVARARHGGTVQWLHSCRGRPRVRPTRWTSGSDADGEIRNSVWTCIR